MLLHFAIRSRERWPRAGQKANRKSEQDSAYLHRGNLWGRPQPVAAIYFMPPNRRIVGALQIKQGAFRMLRNRSGPGSQFDRIAAILAAVVVIGLAIFLLIRNEPIADPKLFFVLRVVMSLSAAILGSTIPGFLNVHWSGGGLIVRAGGALALFVLTFIYTPDLVDHSKSTLIQSSTGPLSPPIGTNSGTVIIRGNGKEN